MENESNTNRAAVGQFVLSLIAFAGTLILAAGSIASGFVYQQAGNDSIQNLLPFQTLGWIAIFLNLVHLYSMVLALRKNPFVVLSSKSKPNELIRSSILLGIWLVFMILGFFGLIPITGSLMAVFTFFALVIPMYWFINSGIRGLDSVSPRKIFGNLSFSSSYLLLIILIIETIMLLVVAIVIFAIFIPYSQIQGWINLLDKYIYQNQINMDQIMRVVNEIISTPAITTTVFLVVGFVAPLVEEVFKPLTVLFIKKKDITPAKGFILGMVGGAAFAFVESSAMVIQFSGESWIQIILLRSATAILHITASGLVGWGYACAIAYKNSKRMFLTILIATILHGFWNSMATMVGLSPLGFTQSIEQYSIGFKEIFGIILLVFEWFSLFFIIRKVNSIIRNEKTLIVHQNEITENSVNLVD